jgi:hypothetical protein
MKKTITEMRASLGLKKVTLSDIEDRVKNFAGGDIRVEMDGESLKISRVSQERINMLADTTQDWPAEYRTNRETLLSLGYVVPGWGGDKILYEYIGRMSHIGLGGWEWDLQLKEFMESLEEDDEWM